MATIGGGKGGSGTGSRRGYTPIRGGVAITPPAPHGSKVSTGTATSGVGAGARPGLGNADAVRRARATANSIDFNQSREAVAAMVKQQMPGATPAAIEAYLSRTYDVIQQRNAEHTPNAVTSAVARIAGAEQVALTGASLALQQAGVGGTKGSTTVVDRSAALRKAWVTRRATYGPSGQASK